MSNVRTLRDTRNSQATSTPASTSPASAQRQPPQTPAAAPVVRPPAHAFRNARNFVITDGLFTATAGDYIEEYNGDVQTVPRRQWSEVRTEDYPLPLPADDNRNRETPAGPANTDGSSVYDNAEGFRIHGGEFRTVRGQTKTIFNASQTTTTTTTAQVANPPRFDASAVREHWAATGRTQSNQDSQETVVYMSEE